MTDFGLSNLLNQGVNLMQTMKIGTAYYVAPEVINTDNCGYDHTIDIWTLGLILDEMIFGSPFYNGESEQEVYDKILQIDYYVRDSCEGKSIKVNPLIQQLLTQIIQRDPKKRPSI